LTAEVRTRIENTWAASDVFASIEQSVGIWQESDGRLRGVSGFCPEVTARVFGLYCSDLRTYPDEEAKRAHHKQLSVESTPPNDPRWDWMVAEPRHYTECHEFSVYGTGQQRQNGKTKVGKRSLPPKIRFAVFARDGWRCIYCGRTAAECALHVDHKISVANGGSDSMENLATACEECNLGKGAANAGAA
jgi:5-methylcytosine-specific restriction endonuclease McrA